MNNNKKNADFAQNCDPFFVGCSIYDITDLQSGGGFRISFTFAIALELCFERANK